jgi:hypothetical protein
MAVAQALVEDALKAVTEANARYIDACKELADARLDHARENPHPWAGMHVYKVMKGDKTRTRAVYGVVVFKERNDPDYGNSHIMPGSYYVLVDNKSAHWLDDTWQLDLL